MAVGTYKEIEARFLEIDKAALVKKLKALKAKNFGDELIKETIFYSEDVSKKWWVRLRKTRGKVFLSYKNRPTATVDGTEEIEFAVSDSDTAKLFLEKVGLVAVRAQEKRRHSFKLGAVQVDIDTWPKIPTMAELEGPSEAALRLAAKALGLDWSDAKFEGPRAIIETRYGIPLGNLRFFTFKKLE